MSDMVENKRAQHKVWLTVALSIFTVAWGGNEFTPLLVFYRGEGFFSDLFIDMLLVFYAIGVAVGLLAAGPLSDRYGRRAVMLPAPLLAMLGSTLIATGEEMAPLIGLGRVFSGIAVGMVMTAGGAWIKELATPRFEPGVKPSAGAKRASMSLTGGFALGPAVAGVMAQWLPLPGQLAYIVHIVLTLVLLPLLFTAPETRQSAHLKTKGSFWADVLVPSALSPRFLFVVAPVGPWVFGAAFTAYAILPTLLRDMVAAPIAYSALIALITLGTGFGIQQFGPQIMGTSKTRGPILAMVATVVGMVGAVIVSLHPHPWWALLVCMFLGLSYGLCMFIGLAETQNIAPPVDMAGLTGIFYCLAYSGMVFPAIMTWLNQWLSYPIMLGFGAAMATLCLLIVSFSTRKV
ncbi:MFS transporter [Corynebacterium crudilactis]|uniref:MFS transporter permease n=1 Tax=Corynebacterium crudilactis TaxID=1652495 RepID=A0A172QQU2_9CORY|nr:MFS transporter [Corynebacterium crudilactis]ANE03048.1 MFS transporter permease [Corynebacterium crudilactis]